MDVFKKWCFMFIYGLLFYFSDPHAINEQLEPINKENLPKCKHCGHLLRPYIVWFGENLDPNVMNRSSKM